MAVTKKGKLTVIFAVIVPILLIALLIINWFVYPFVSAKPNFADVEAVYDKMVVPADWVKKGEGANKGIAGRQCPVESDGCFSKVATFSVPVDTSGETVKKVFATFGCISTTAERSVQKGGVSYTDFECSGGGVFPWATLTETGSDGWDLSIGVSSR